MVVFKPLLYFKSFFESLKKNIERTTKYWVSPEKPIKEHD